MAHRALLIGDLVAAYGPYIAAALRTPWELIVAAEGECPASADALLAVRWQPTDQLPAGVRLFQVAAAGYDNVVLAAIPPEVAVCNAYGHEPAIGECVLMTPLAWTHRLPATGRHLRDGDCSVDLLTGADPWRARRAGRARRRHRPHRAGPADHDVSPVTLLSEGGH